MPVQENSSRGVAYAIEQEMNLKDLRRLQVNSLGHF